MFSGVLAHVRLGGLVAPSLKKLLDGHIVCESVEECGKGGYRFTATETFDRLLTGVDGINQSGGGHPQLALFCPTIRVPLRRSSHKLIASSKSG